MFRIPSMIRQKGKESIKIVPEPEGDKPWKFLLMSYFTVPNFFGFGGPKK